MRPNQQNMNKQRSRGRNNNNQRRGGGGNPLSRNYESNGPDVKIRGNASHIAEKYTQLARDAAASGDNVMAENYLQHAEHYNRIILAAQAQFQPRQDQQAEAGTEDEPGEDEAVKADAKPETVEAESRAEEVAGEEGKPRRVQRQRRPRREKTEDAVKAEGNEAEAASEPAPAVAAEANGAAEAEEKPKRARRAPRRTTKKADSDLADAPQPDLGELPAFLTAGREAAAE